MNVGTIWSEACNWLLLSKFSDFSDRMKVPAIPADTMQAALATFVDIWQQDEVSAQSSDSDKTSKNDICLEKNRCSLEATIRATK